MACTKGNHMPYISMVPHSDTKIERHPSNILGDILNFMIHSSHLQSFWRHQFSNKDLNISATKEGIPK